MYNMCKQQKYDILKEEGDDSPACFCVWEDSRHDCYNETGIQSMATESKW